MVDKSMITFNRFMIYIFLCTLLFFFSCRSNDQHKENFKDYYSNMNQEFIADKSLSINEIELTLKNKNWTITGKTNKKNIYNELADYADSMLYAFKVNFLPDSSLKDSIYGIVNVSVTPLRQEPQHSSQMVDQAIMGNHVKLYEKVGDWFLCQTEYDYVGWINKTSIIICDTTFFNMWKKNAIYRIKSLQSTVYSNPDILSIPVSDVVLNNIIHKIKDFNGWSQISLPDARIGFISTKDIILDNHVTKDENLNKKIAERAKSLIGTPYLWGGNSSKGSDCSGFTQTIFRSEGIQLPRDARQQALLGNKTNVESSIPGDLFFFGDGIKITHVGISLGGMDFIHQGGKVAINSLDPKSNIYNNYRAESFMYARRVTTF